MISNPIYKSFLILGILAVFGISFWIIKKSLLRNEEKSIMVVDKELFNNIKNNKLMKCKICNMKFSDDLKCEFSTIKCAKDKNELFHYECFIKEMGKPCKCPVCKFECLEEFYMFTRDLVRSLLLNENIATKFKLLRQQVKVFEATLGICLLDEGKLNMNEVNKIAENLEKNSINNEMKEFAAVLRKCGQMNEIFEMSKRKLFNEVIKGRYSSEEFYPIYFNSNKEMIEELSNEEIVELLSIYCIEDNFSLGLRLAYLTIFLTRMYLKERQFDPENMKSLLLSGIRNQNILALGVIRNYVCCQPYINFEKFNFLLKEAIKNINEEDLGFVIDVLKDYYKDISVNLIEILKVFLENDKEYVKVAVCNVFPEKGIMVSFLVLKEILNVYKSTDSCFKNFIPIIQESISQLNSEEFEEFLIQVKELKDNEVYNQVSAIWLEKHRDSIDKNIIRNR